MRDLVQVHITADLPIRALPMPFADRVEIRLGKAFPVVLVIDRTMLGPLGDAIEVGRKALDQADRHRPDPEG